MRIQIRKILCPVDFSENADHAAQYALVFAQTHQAELKFLHVLDHSAFNLPDFPSIIDFSTEMIEEIRDSFQKRLEEWINPWRQEYPHVISSMIMGTPFLEIINTAREDQTDLLIMSTHGRSGLAHVLMGSVTERVVRKAPCPVLTVKHPEHEFIMP